MLVHAAAFNLGLLMRSCFGFGTPRSLQGLAAAAAALADASVHAVLPPFFGQIRRVLGLQGPNRGSLRPSGRPLHNKTAITRLLPFVQPARWQTTSSTAC